MLFIKTEFFFSFLQWFKIKSEKNQDLLVVDNYIRRFDRKRNKTQYFQGFGSCGGCAILKNYVNVVTSKPHNHGTHGVELAERGFQNKLRVSV